jgi:hypothetical protein
MDTKKLRLESRRIKLMEKIVGVGPWMEGTVVATERICGKKNCVCHTEGRRHPVMYVTWKEAGKTVSLYVPKGMEQKAREWTGNYKKLKELLREVSVIQRQVLRLRDD